MCLFTDTFTTKKADHDIVCYKIVGYKNSIKCICPPYYFMTVKLGERYDIPKEVEPRITRIYSDRFLLTPSHPKKPDWAINGGAFHTYQKLEDAITDLPNIHGFEGIEAPSWFIVECKIPQGSEYWDGWARVCGDTEPKTYASRSIVYTDNIIGFDKRVTNDNIKKFVKEIFPGFRNYKRYLRTNWYIK